nr:uncharacterized protein LOC100903664 [Haemonchus contortus]
MRRQVEDDYHREARLAANAERARAIRDAEEEERRETRLEQEAVISRIGRRQGSDEIQENPRAREAMRARLRREQEDDAMRQQRHVASAQRERTRRERETSAETRQRRRAVAERYHTRVRSISAQTRGVARTNAQPDEHYDGQMNVACESCGAKHFKSESKGKRTFNDCCNHGSISLRHFNNYPVELRRLLTSQEIEAKEFRKHIRNYNSAFAFASMGAQLDTSRGHGPYCFRIHGQIYHRIGPVLPEDGQPHRYGQVYILDTSMAAEERIGNPANTSCNPRLIQSLGELLHRINVFAQAYKMLHEVAVEEELCAAREGRPAKAVRMVFETPANVDRRRYNAPIANEVAVIYVGNDGDVPTEHSLAVHLRGGGLQTIRVIDPECDPLTYPILFPRGELGWHPNMLKRPSERRRTRLTQKEYYSSMIAARGDFNPLHFAGKLYQQFLVDSYIKIEQNRLNFDRTHQAELRVDSYRGLADYVTGDNDITGPAGVRRVILPSSFPGSPRAMVQNYQDAMAIVSKYGKPDLFITFTCNPAWREITEQLENGQTASDRPDIVARVFNIKLQELYCDLVKRQVLGAVSAYISVMEWQKRGLPHCHILITLAEQDKPRSVSDIDSIVQAVIPDQRTEPRLYNIVTSCMMHRPCGQDNPHSPCMIDGECSKRFPKQFRDETNSDLDGYPEYRRPNDGRTCISGGKVLDNRSVVPYNRYLALRYNGHLNVEICGMIQAVKYMYKYVYKGPDRAALHMVRRNDSFNDREINEIDEYVNARYVCAPEAVHRLLGFELQSKSDTVYRLQVHLPDYQTVTFQGGREEEALRRAAERDTMLTAFFKLNEEHEMLYSGFDVPEGQKDARTLLYIQLPEFFTFDNQSRKWKPRVRQNRQIGRMYTANPLDVERYSLRILLLHRRGPKSFNDLKTVDGVLHDTFKDAAKALGLMNDDTHYDSCLSEASGFQMPAQLRSLFSSLLCFCSITEPVVLWDKFKRALAEDHIRRGVSESEAILRTYYDIMDKMQICGVNLMNIITPPSDQRPAQLIDEELTEAEHVLYGERLMEQLNDGPEGCRDQHFSLHDWR